MKLFRKMANLAVVIIMVVSVWGSNALAATYEMDGYMYYRVIFGNENNKYYTIGSNTFVLISGVVQGIGYNEDEVERDITGQKVGVQATHLDLYETKSSGEGECICSDEVRVVYGDEQNFYASGTTKYNTKKYMYIYKGLNDGYDLHISGSVHAYE